jgi:hypothetical protein
MIRNTLVFIALISFGLLSSCTSSLYTFADYDRHIDLNQYNSYSWLPPSDTALADINNQALEQMYSKVVISAANAELEKKGMVPDPVKPDVLFRYKLGIDARTQYSQSPTVSVGVGIGGPFYYTGAAVPVSGGTIKEHRADEAFLYLQMFDTRTGYLIWSGGARKTVDNSADSQRNIKLALNAILSKLPIRHKSSQ